MNVVNMSDYKATVVKPKSEGRTHKGQHYTLLYAPNALPLFRWGWRVRYVKEYEFSGSAPTIEKAAIAARRKIDELKGRDRGTA